MATFPQEAVSIPELPIADATTIVDGDLIVIQQSNGTKGLSISDLKEMIGKERIGTIQIFTFTDIPSNYLICDGSDVNISDYPDLSSLLNGLFNTPDTPSGKFGLPNLQDRFIRGASSTNPLGQPQDDALQNITGVVPAFFDNRGQPSGAFASGAGWSMPLNFDGGQHAGNNFTFDASRVARTATETRPKNMPLVFAIKAK